MKFPTSIHADGWDDHFDDAPVAVKTNNPALKRGFKAGAKPVSAHTPLHLDASSRTSIPATPAASPAYTHATAPAVRPAAPVTSPAPRASSVPWVVGAGVGVLLIGGAVVMSRNTTPAEPSVPVVVGQATPSPEDAQLQNAPSSAGLVTPAPEPTPEVVAADKPEAPPAKVADEAPVMKQPAPAETRMAKAPVPSAPPAVAAAPAARMEAPAPVVRTLTPQPEVLAQASPPMLREAPQAAAPVTVPVVPPSATPSALPATPAETASTPLAAAPVTPPVVAQQAPAPVPAVPDPADTGITIQVRQALAADMTLAAVPIAVSTDHGVVKLEGQAPDAQARDRATVVAANTSGVKGVDNRLTLPPVASLDRGTISNGG